MAMLKKSTDSSGLAEVINTILDKGIVIDAWATVALVGIQILAIEARVVIASVATYLQYAEAMGLTEAGSVTETVGMTEAMSLTEAGDPRVPERAALPAAAGSPVTSGVPAMPEAVPVGA